MEENIFLANGTFINNIKGDNVQGNKINQNINQQIHTGNRDNKVKQETNIEQKGIFGINKITNQQMFNDVYGNFYVKNITQQIHTGNGDNIALSKSVNNNNKIIKNPSDQQELKYNEECFNLICRIIYGYNDCITNETSSMDYNIISGQIYKDISENPKLSAYFEKFRSQLINVIKKQLPPKFEKLLKLLDILFLD